VNTCKQRKSRHIQEANIKNQTKEKGSFCIRTISHKQTSFH